MRLLRGHIGGLALSNDGTSPQTVIDTSAGVATSDDATTMMKLASFTKSTSAWAVGSGNGCLDSGSVANSTWYHLFVIERTDTGVVDELCSTSATAPTLPTNYTKKRRIGSFKTDASAHILAFTQYGSGNRRKYLWVNHVADNSGAALTSGGRVSIGLASIPQGIKVDSIVNYTLHNGTNQGAAGLYSPDMASNINITLALTTTNNNVGGVFIIGTNASQQIIAFASTTGLTLDTNTEGWYDDI